MLSFSSFTVFKDTASNQVIEFFPATEGNKIVWRGAGVDKLGTYRFLEDHLEISFNYAREERYLLTVLQAREGIVIRFRLKDRSGQETEFSRTGTAE